MKKSPTPLDQPIADTKESPTEAVLFRSLGHPLRRKVIRFINERGSVSYTDLRDAFRIEPGTLYFHLEQLMKPDAPLLKQSKEKTYDITSLGRLAATFLNQATDITPSMAPPTSTERHRWLRQAVYYLGFAPLFRYLTRREDHLILESLIILGALAYLFTMVPLLLIGFLPLEFLFTWIYFPTLSFLGSWFLITLASELVTRYRYHAPEGRKSLFAATVYAWLPIGVYGLIRWFAAPILIAWPVLTFIILFLCLTWTLWVYTQAIVHAKRIALRKAALTTIIITNIALLGTLLLLIRMMLP
ncbi:MAG: helix-turn-helix domain-containing protein [Candidatus Hermodarchaeota archaeon]|nr:helix-turn-helix domain-containing protein [Candidatus Hermodarchaeota archaeon]